MYSQSLPDTSLHRDKIMDLSLAPLPTPPVGYQWVNQGKDWQLLDVHGQPMPLPPENAATATAVAADSASSKLAEVVSDNSNSVPVQDHNSLAIQPAEQIPKPSPVPGATVDQGSSLLVDTAASPDSHKIHVSGNAHRAQNDAHEKQPAESLLPDFYEHVVMPGDTFQGLCLRYKIKARLLRKHNGLTSDSLRGVVGKTLRIPTDHLTKGDKSVTPQVLKKEDMAVEKFRQLAPGLGSIEAKLYLEDHDYDTDKALAAWKVDEDWEQGTAAQQHQHRKEYLELKQKQEIARKAEETFVASAASLRFNGLPLTAAAAAAAAALCCLESRRREGEGGGGNDDGGGGDFHRDESKQQQVEKAEDGAALEQLGNRRREEAELTTAVI